MGQNSFFKITIGQFSKTFEISYYGQRVRMGPCSFTHVGISIVPQPRMERGISFILVYNSSSLRPIKMGQMAT